MKKKCQNCKFYLSFQNCGIIGMTEKLVKTYNNEKYESPYEKEISLLHIGECGFPLMCRGQGLTYNGIIADTTKVNKNGNCKYYKRKWYKFWIR